MVVYNMVLGVNGKAFEDRDATRLVKIDGVGSKQLLGCLGVG